MSIPGTVVSSPSCKHRAWSRAIVFLSVLPLAGCIASAPGNNQQPTVSVTPTNPSVPGGDVIVFTATSNVPNPQLTWFLGGASGTQCGPAMTTLGLLTCGPGPTQATFLAPATVPNPDTIQIVAMLSSASGTVSSTATVTVTASNVGITLAPTTASVAPGGTVSLSATLTGTTYDQVGWEVNGVPNGNKTYGTIAFVPATLQYSPNVTYTAPATVPPGVTSVTITAAAVANSAQTATAVMTFSSSSGTPAVSLSPTTTTVASGGTQLFTATVTGTSNQAVNWLVVGGANNGTIVSSPPNSLTATYTAPTLQSGGSNQTVTVTAQSQADTSVQANATVTVTPPGAVTVSSPGASIPVGGTFQYTATEAGVPNATFNWSVSALSGCTSTSLGSIDSNGLYTAPPLTATLSVSPCPVQITATVPGGGASGSVLANLHVTVTTNASPGTIGAGANWLFTATVNGASPANQGVSWSFSGTPGTCTPGLGSFPTQSPPYTDPNAGFYVAPLCVPPSDVTINAASAFDPQQGGGTKVSIQPSDPVGTATSTTITCPAGIGGTTGATCYQLDVSCPGVADWPNTYLKVNQPSGTPLGTVILATGSGGNYAYDADPDFLESDGITNGGLTVVEGILNTSVPDAGYTTAQVAFSPLDNPGEFPNGWLTGPGGVRRLACRYATVTQWVYANVQSSNASLPMCATGNSGGAGAIAYALTDYGENNILSMVETTSGPPMTRLDLACVPSSQGTTMPFVCNPGDPSQNLPLNYSPSEAEIIDPAYPAQESFCSNTINQSGTQAPAGLFLSDMILGGPQPPNVGPTYINIVLGGLDTTAAVQQAQKWGQALNLNRRVCVEDAPHALPSVADGAQQIVTDIQNLCKLQ
jgi:hypothetical protein